MDLPRTYKHRILCIALEHDNAPLMTTTQYVLTIFATNRSRSARCKGSIINYVDIIY